jgi:hypothetical protein
VGGGLLIERRGEVPLRAAEVDGLLDGPPAPQRGDLEEVLPRPRRGLVRGCRHGGLLRAGAWRAADASSFAYRSSGRSAPAGARAAASSKTGSPVFTPSDGASLGVKTCSASMHAAVCAQRASAWPRFASPCPCVKGDLLNVDNPRAYQLSYRMRKKTCSTARGACTRAPRPVEVRECREAAEAMPARLPGTT